MNSLFRNVKTINVPVIKLLSRKVTPSLSALENSIATPPTTDSKSHPLRSRSLPPSLYNVPNKFGNLFLSYVNPNEVTSNNKTGNQLCHANQPTLKILNKFRKNYSQRNFGRVKNKAQGKQIVKRKQERRDRFQEQPFIKPEDDRARKKNQTSPYITRGTRSSRNIHMMRSTSLPHLPIFDNKVQNLSTQQQKTSQKPSIKDLVDLNEDIKNAKYKASILTRKKSNKITFHYLAEKVECKQCVSKNKRRFREFFKNNELQMNSFLQKRRQYSTYDSTLREKMMDKNEKMEEVIRVRDQNLNARSQNPTVTLFNLIKMNTSKSKTGFTPTNLYKFEAKKNLEEYELSPENKDIEREPLDPYPLEMFDEDNVTSAETAREVKIVKAESCPELTDFEISEIKNLSPCDSCKNRPRRKGSKDDKKNQKSRNVEKKKRPRRNAFMSESKQEVESIEFQTTENNDTFKFKQPIESDTNYKGKENLPSFELAKKKCPDCGRGTKRSPCKIPVPSKKHKKDKCVENEQKRKPCERKNPCDRLLKNNIIGYNDLNIKLAQKQYPVLMDFKESQSKILSPMSANKPTTNTETLINTSSHNILNNPLIQVSELKVTPKVDENPAATLVQVNKLNSPLFPRIDGRNLDVNNKVRDSKSSPLQLAIECCLEIKCPENISGEVSKPIEKIEIKKQNSVMNKANTDDQYPLVGSKSPSPCHAAKDNAKNKYFEDLLSNKNHGKFIDKNKFIEVFETRRQHYKTLIQSAQNSAAKQYEKGLYYVHPLNQTISEATSKVVKAELDEESNQILANTIKKMIEPIIEKEFLKYEEVKTALDRMEKRLASTLNWLKPTQSTTVLETRKTQRTALKYPWQRIQPTEIGERNVNAQVTDPREKIYDHRDPVKRSSVCTPAWKQNEIYKDVTDKEDVFTKREDDYDPCWKTNPKKDYKKKGSDKATPKMGIKSKTGSNNNKTDSCEEANNIITKSKKTDSFASLCKKENKHDSCEKDDPCKKQDLGACRKIENPCKKEENKCKTEQNQCTKSNGEKTDTFALLSGKVNKHDPDQADDSCTSPKDFCKKYEDCAETCDPCTKPETVCKVDPCNNPICETKEPPCSPPCKATSPVTEDPCDKRDLKGGVITCRTPPVQECYEPCRPKTTCNTGDKFPMKEIQCPKCPDGPRLKSWPPEPCNPPPKTGCCLRNIECDAKCPDVTEVECIQSPCKTCDYHEKQALRDIGKSGHDCKEKNADYGLAGMKVPIKCDLTKNPPCSSKGSPCENFIHLHKPTTFQMKSTIDSGKQKKPCKGKTEPCNQDADVSCPVICKKDKDTCLRKTVCERDDKQCDSAVLQKMEAEKKRLADTEARIRKEKEAVCQKPVMFKPETRNQWNPVKIQADRTNDKKILKKKPKKCVTDAKVKTHSVTGGKFSCQSDGAIRSKMALQPTAVHKDKTLMESYTEKVSDLCMMIVRKQKGGGKAAPIIVTLSRSQPAMDRYGGMSGMNMVTNGGSHGGDSSGGSGKKPPSMSPINLFRSSSATQSRSSDVRRSQRNTSEIFFNVEGYSSPLETTSKCAKQKSESFLLAGSKTNKGECSSDKKNESDPYNCVTKKKTGKDDLSKKKEDSCEKLERRKSECKEESYDVKDSNAQAKLMECLKRLKEKSKKAEHEDKCEKKDSASVKNTDHMCENSKQDAVEARKDQCATKDEGGSKNNPKLKELENCLNKTKDKGTPTGQDQKDFCKKKEDPSKKKEDACKKGGDPCKKKEDPSKNKEDPCKQKDDPCKKKNDPPKKKEDSCERKEDPSKKKEDPCKQNKEAKDPCGKLLKQTASSRDPCKQKEDPCQQKKDPCKKKEDPCKKKEDPCKKTEDPCKKKDDPSKKKEDPCEKKEPSKKKEDPCKMREDPCKKNKDPCKKKEDLCKKKEDPCKKKEPSQTKEDSCKMKEDHRKNNEDPCKKREEPCKKKEDPCKKKEDPCKKKEDPCKKKEDPHKKKVDPCKKKEEFDKKREDPCKKKEDPSKKKEDFCKKKEDPCKKKEDPCKKMSTNKFADCQATLCEFASKPKDCKDSMNKPLSKNSSVKKSFKDKYPWSMLKECFFPSSNAIKCKSEKSKSDHCLVNTKKTASKSKSDPCVNFKSGNDQCKVAEKLIEKFQVQMKSAKNDPCGKQSHEKDDPYNCVKRKKNEASSSKQKDASKEKEDPCKKKEDPCKKKEDPCKKREDPCKKKEDPCKKKEDPCKKKQDPHKKQCHSKQSMFSVQDLNPDLNKTPQDAFLKILGHHHGARRKLPSISHAWQKIGLDLSVENNRQPNMKYLHTTIYLITSKSVGSKQKRNKGNCVKSSNSNDTAEKIWDPLSKDGENGCMLNKMYRKKSTSDLFPNKCKVDSTIGIIEFCRLRMMEAEKRSCRADATNRLEYSGPSLSKINNNLNVSENEDNDKILEKLKYIDDNNSIQEGHNEDKCVCQNNNSTKPLQECFRKCSNNHICQGQLLQSSQMHEISLKRFKNGSGNEDHHIILKKPKNIDNNSIQEVPNENKDVCQNNESTKPLQECFQKCSNDHIRQEQLQSSQMHAKSLDCLKNGTENENNDTIVKKPGNIDNNNMIQEIHNEDEDVCQNNRSTKPLQECFKKCSNYHIHQEQLDSSQMREKSLERLKKCLKETQSEDTFNENIVKPDKENKVLERNNKDEKDLGGINTKPLQECLEECSKRKWVINETSEKECGKGRKQLTTNLACKQNMKNEQEETCLSIIKRISEETVSKETTNCLSDHSEPPNNSLATCDEGNKEDTNNEHDANCQVMKSENTQGESMSTCHKVLTEKRDIAAKQTDSKSNPLDKLSETCVPLDNESLKQERSDHNKKSHNKCGKLLKTKHPASEHNENKKCLSEETAGSIHQRCLELCRRHHNNDMNENSETCKNEKITEEHTKDCANNEEHKEIRPNEYLKLKCSTNVNDETNNTVDKPVEGYLKLKCPPNVRDNQTAEKVVCEVAAKRSENNKCERNSLTKEYIRLKCPSVSSESLNVEKLCTQTNKFNRKNVGEESDENRLKYHQNVNIQNTNENEPGFYHASEKTSVKSVDNECVEEESLKLTCAKLDKYKEEVKPESSERSCQGYIETKCEHIENGNRGIRNTIKKEISCEGIQEALARPKSELICEHPSIANKEKFDKITAKNCENTLASFQESPCDGNEEHTSMIAKDQSIQKGLKGLTTLLPEKQLKEAKDMGLLRQCLLMTKIKEFPLIKPVTDKQIEKEMCSGKKIICKVQKLGLGEKLVCDQVQDDDVPEECRPKPHFNEDGVERVLSCSIVRDRFRREKLVCVELLPENNEETQIQDNFKDAVQENCFKKPKSKVKVISNKLVCRKCPAVGDSGKQEFSCSLVKVEEVKVLNDPKRTNRKLRNKAGNTATATIENKTLKTNNVKKNNNYESKEYR